MSIRAGASLPGPFFITFPVGGPIIGLIAIMIAPFAFMLWLVYIFLYGIVWLIAQMIPAAGQAALHANDLRIEARDAKPRLSAEDQAFLDGIMNR